MIVARISAAQLTVGSVLRLSHPPYDILVANVDGTLFAIEDACPHSGRSLSGGHLEGRCIVCPGHGWRIDLSDGLVKTPAGEGLSNPRFRVERLGDEVLVYESERS